MDPAQTIAIVDYGAGNLRSVERAVLALGHPNVVTSDPEVVLAAAGVILPGVGAAGDLMRSLRALGLIEPIKAVIAADRPFLGVCMGLQALFKGSEEGGWQECLGILPGVVRRLPAGLKIPHMGWNQVRQTRAHPIWADIPDRANFYFVHSFYVDPIDRSVVAGDTEYDDFVFCSAAARGNLFATQFHPEKSSTFGLKIYDNFCRLALPHPHSPGLPHPPTPSPFGTGEGETNAPTTAPLRAHGRGDPVGRPPTEARPIRKPGDPGGSPGRG